MVETFTMLELLTIYAGMKHRLPARLDCSVDPLPGSGTDMFEMLRSEMHAWYLDTLDSVPLEPPYIVHNSPIYSLIPVADFSNQCVAARTPCGAVRLALPAGVRRLVSIRLVGWHRDAVIVRDPSSPLALAQLNPFSRGTPEAPVAVVQQCGRSLMLYSLPDDNSPVYVDSLVAVPEPTPGQYRLDRSLLYSLLNN